MTCRQCIPVRLDQYVNRDPSLYSRPGLYLKPGLYSRKYGTLAGVASARLVELGLARHWLDRRDLDALRRFQQQQKNVVIRWRA